MSCYVDTPQWERNGLPSGHLIADSLPELHAMAERIELPRSMFVSHAIVPHYTLLALTRPAAIAAGAIALEKPEWNRQLQRAREGCRGLVAGHDPIPPRRRARPHAPIQESLL